MSQFKPNLPVMVIGWSLIIVLTVFTKIEISLNDKQHYIQAGMRRSLLN